MEIKTKKSFNDLIASLTEEVIEEEALDEITTTDDIAGYDSPLAFGDTSRASKKKKKKISTNSTGYDMVNEDLSSNDIKTIKKLIRKTVSNIFRDLWIKRSVWKNPTQ